MNKIVLALIVSLGLVFNGCLAADRAQEINNARVKQYQAQQASNTQKVQIQTRRQQEIQAAQAREQQRAEEAKRLRAERRGRGALGMAMERQAMAQTMPVSTCKSCRPCPCR